MNLLAFDTSTENLSVAVARDNGTEEILHESSYFGALQHAEKIIGLIQQALCEAKINLSDIDSFLIGTGPGSFTGLRVGFATLQGFAVSSGKPCYGISSLDVVAQNGKMHSGTIAVIQDARRERVYLGIYENQPDHPIKNKLYLCVSPEEALEKLLEIAGDLWITGHGLIKYASLLESSLKKAVYADKQLWYPKGSSLVQDFKEKKGFLKPMSLEECVPTYLQEPHTGPAKARHGKK